MKEANERLRAAARALRQHAPPFVLIGSAALSVWYPELDERYACPDLDVLVGSASDALRLATVLRGVGFAITCWGVAVDPTTAIDEVEGKLYLRATRDDLQLDATFESATIDITRVMARSAERDGLPVAELEDVWESKLRADPRRTLSFASSHGLEVPAAVIARAVGDGGVGRLGRA